MSHAIITGVITNLDYLLIGFFLIVFPINILLIRGAYKRALKKYVIPELSNKGLIIIDHKWLGFGNSGDFNEKTWVIGGPVIMRGSPFLSLYVAVYHNENGEKKRITAKIDLIVYFIRKVTYSST